MRVHSGLGRVFCRTTLVLFASALAAGLGSTQADAQPGLEASTSPPEPPTAAAPLPQSAAQVPASTPEKQRTPAADAGSAANPSSAGNACFPRCRGGYVCHQGLCVTACNPPCARDEVCTDQAQNASGNATVDVSPGQPICAALPETRRAASEPSPNAYAHDGFMLRLAVGIGWAGAWQDAGALRLDDGVSSSVRLSGFSGFFSLDLGGSIRPNLILHGRISAMVLADPEVDGNATAEAILKDPDTAAGTVLFGLGLTYYLMPLNAYASLVVGLTQTIVEFDGASNRTDGGWGTELDLGKEWWVGRQWGLGTALRLSLAHAPRSEDEGNDAVTFGVGVLFTATYQ